MKHKKASSSQFWGLLKITEIPWVMIAATCLVCIVHTVLSMILPDISSRLLAGEFTDENLKTMIWVLAVSAFALALRQFLLEISKSQVTLSFRKSVFGKLLRLTLRHPAARRWR